MKKWLAVVAILALTVTMAVSALASDSITLIDNEQFGQNETVGVTSNTLNSRNYSKGTFYVYHTLIGTTGQALIYLDTSFDGSTWFNTSFRSSEMAKSSAPITSYTLTTTAAKVCFFDTEIVAPYVRARVYPALITDANAYVYDTIQFIGQQQ